MKNSRSSTARKSPTSRSKWRDDAEVDDGAWLHDVLDHPDVSTPELVEAQVKLLELIPVEEPEDDWDPNYLLY